MNMQETQAAPKRGRTSARPAERRPGPRWLALAGIVGPTLFTVTFIAQEVSRLDEYSSVAEPVSALEAGPNGWIQQANFVVFGLLTIAFAVGLHRGIRTSTAGIIGPAILVLGGVGLLLVGAVFPLREDAAGVTYDPGGHYVVGPLFFLCIAVAHVVLWPRLAGDPRWRGLAGYTLGAGIILTALFVAMPVLVVPDDAPLHPGAGLAQRVILLVWFTIMIALAIRLLRGTRESRR